MSSDKLFTKTYIARLLPGDVFAWEGHKGNAHFHKLLIAIFFDSGSCSLTFLNTQGHLFRVTHWKTREVYRFSREGE
jgi:hypothetical protein